jgi:hypothetical protein
MANAIICQGALTTERKFRALSQCLFFRFSNNVASLAIIISSKKDLVLIGHIYFSRTVDPRSCRKKNLPEN